MSFSLKELSANLRRLPTTLAAKVTAAAAPALTSVANSTVAASQDPYGVPWAPGADGKKVTLHRTGALLGFLHYVGIGTRLRVSLGVRYAKYQLGRRPVFPRQGAALPPDYVKTLQQTTAQAIRSSLEGR